MSRSENTKLQSSHEYTLHRSTQKVQSCYFATLKRCQNALAMGQVSGMVLLPDESHSSQDHPGALQCAYILQKSLPEVDVD
jgi:hypothetical protein